MRTKEATNLLKIIQKENKFMSQEVEEVFFSFLFLL